MGATEKERVMFYFFSLCGWLAEFLDIGGFSTWSMTGLVVLILIFARAGSVGVARACATFQTTYVGIVEKSFWSSSGFGCPRAGSFALNGEAGLTRAGPCLSGGGHPPSNLWRVAIRRAQGAAR